MSADPAAEIVRALRSQFRAALATLAQIIDSCDDATWEADHSDDPVNRVVFHTLFFADLYLDRGEDVVRTQAFHREHPALFQDYEELEDREPRNVYSQADCRAYLAHCRRKVDTVLPRESLEVLMGESGFAWRRISRLALHVYNIRHIQHHAAQLGLRRQLSGGPPLEWESGE